MPHACQTDRPGQMALQTLYQIASLTLEAD